MISAENKELIIQSYQKTFDKEMAYLKVGLSEEEIAFADKDKELQTRLQIYLIDERERIINNFRTFMDSADEKVSYQATCKLAEVLYPDFFKAKDNGAKRDIIEDPLTREEAERLLEEYGLVSKALNQEPS